MTLRTLLEGPLVKRELHPNCTLSQEGRHRRRDHFPMSEGLVAALLDLANRWWNEVLNAWGSRAAALSRRLDP